MSGELLLSFECIFGQILNFKLFSKLLDVISNCFVIIISVVEVIFFLSPCSLLLEVCVSGGPLLAGVSRTIVELKFLLFWYYLVDLLNFV